jgi:hypothetical protein
MNDFFPAVISIAILAAVFLGAWASDRRRIRRLNVPLRIRTRVDTVVAMRDNNKAPFR